MGRLPYVIAVDFDGTLCENAYPKIGAPRMGIIKKLKKIGRGQGDFVDLP